LYSSVVVRHLKYKYTHILKNSLITHITSASATTSLFSSPSHSAAAAYERIASAITIAEELQLGYTRPELPLSPVLRNVRFVYYNPVDCSLKVIRVALCCCTLCNCVSTLSFLSACYEAGFFGAHMRIYFISILPISQVCGINNSDLSPMLCAPRHFREYIAANISSMTGKSIPTSHYANTTSGTSAGGASGSGSKGKKVAGMVVEKLCDRAGYKFPASSSLLAGTCCSSFCA